MNHDSDDVDELNRRPSLPAVSASISVPRLSRLAIERDAPLIRLDRASSDTFCVVHAPAGYGKTTLLAQWARRRRRDADSEIILWVTIDSSCNTRMPFWRHVTSLVRDVAQASGAAPAAIVPDGDISTSLVRLIGRSFEELDAPVVLIVDAWENISDPSVSEDLLRVVRNTENLSLVIATRSIDAEWLTTAAPHGLSMLKREDLEFSVEDYAALAKRAGVPLDAREIRTAVETTGGWPFALRMMLDESRDHLHAELNGLTSLEALRERLVDEFSRTAGFEYLLVTSIIESFTFELAAWLGADSDDSHILDVVESRGLGAWEAGALPVFRLQPVLREGLLASLGRDESRRLYRRLAQWQEQKGRLTQAFFSALDAEDAALAVSLAQRAFVPITVALNRAPEALTSQRRSFFSREPLLSLLNGISHNIAGHTARAAQLFVKTIALSEAKLVGNFRHPTPDHVWVQAALTAGLRLVGRYELVEPAYRRFRRMLQRVDDPHGILQAAETVFATSSAMTLIFLGRLDEAQHVLRGETHPRGGRNSRHDYSPPCISAYIEAADGEIAQAQSSIASLEDEGLPRHFDASFYSVPLHLARALIMLEHGLFDDAESELQHCMLHWKTIEMWPLLVEVSVHIAWQRQGHLHALTVLDSMIAEKNGHPPISPEMTALLDELRAMLLIAKGSLAPALALTSARRCRTHPRLAVPRALAHLIGGQPDRALATANSVSDAQRLTQRQRITLKLLAASAHLRLEDIDVAGRGFGDAADRALSAGLRSPFSIMPRSDVRAFLHRYARADEIQAILDESPELFPRPGTSANLTEREHVVLRHLATEATLTEISGALSVSVNTVKTQARAVYRKLGVANRGEAVREANHRGIL